MRAILVSVDYADILAVTLPHNRHHFSEVWVVTTPTDLDTIKIASENACKVVATDAFYDGGAAFAKWKALEEGLSLMGRHGWICNMDADVCWPKEVWSRPMGKKGLILGRPKQGQEVCDVQLVMLPGFLCTPLRRMAHDPLSALLPSGEVAPTSTWSNLPLHPQQQEFAGYTQIFHAEDRVLGPPPWHETDWIHAGGADSAFQAKWSPRMKVRPPFEVLHLGEAGVNWLGRASRRLDGSLPEGGEERRKRLQQLIRQRRPGLARFAAEKLPPHSDNPK